MSNPEQWWDTRLTDKKTYDFFVENLGPINMPSRVAAREIARGLGVTSVLDVGCGPAIDRWHDTGIHWTGCDSSAVLHDKNQARGIGIDQAPAHLLPYRQGEFELVYSRHVWEHLPDFRPALSEACRVAKRAVIITFFRPPGFDEVINVSDGAYYNTYRLSDITAAFRAAWPGCQMSECRIAQQKYLPDGEVILTVWR